MKMIWATLAVSLVLCGCERSRPASKEIGSPSISGTSTKDAGRGPNATIMRVLNASLPHDKEARDAFLWNNFANKPEEEQFNSYRSDGWKDNYAAFANALVQKANEQKLDSTSLHEVLDLIL